MPRSRAVPGVFTQDPPGDHRTITATATSVTGFVGRTRRGAVHEPISCASFADFERQCGGLWADSELGYAVRHYFLNGGERAVVCRVVDSVTTATATLDYNGAGALILSAADPGGWGNNLRVTVDVGATGTMSAADDANSFHLTIDEIDPVVEAADGYEPAVSRRESHPNVSIDPTSSRYVVTWLAQHSALARVQASTAMPDQSLDAGLLPAAAPAVTFRDGSDGLAGDVVPTDVEGAIDRLGDADIVNLVCVPPLDRNTETATTTWAYALRWSEAHRAILLVDPPTAWTKAQDAAELSGGFEAFRSANVAFYFPRVTATDPLRAKLARPFVPCGAVAGRIAHTDRTRGVWKAPAGIDTTLSGVSGLEFEITDHDSSLLNPSGINALRLRLARGPMIWGARTGRGADDLSSEWRYLPVRRTALFIEESLDRGLKWTVFEPNDEPLWAALRLTISAFMHGLFLRGAFQGKRAQEAYLVRCDASTTTPADIDTGIVNVLVGFAPLKPAEFIVLHVRQRTVQTDS